MYFSFNIQNIIFKIIAITIVLCVHEFSKSFVSYKLGDISVKNDGRLTLNPLVHLEPVGFFILLLTGYGWGKPVNTSALYYKNRKTGTLLTYTIPILVSLVFGILILFILDILGEVTFPSLLTGDVVSKISFMYRLVVFLTYLYTYSIKLAIFNLIPISPLCGEKILMSLLPSNKAFEYYKYQKAIQIIVVLLLLSGFLTKFLDLIFSSISYILIEVVGEIF